MCSVGSWSSAWRPPFIATYTEVFMWCWSSSKYQRCLQVNRQLIKALILIEAKYNSDQKQSFCKNSSNNENERIPKDEPKTTFFTFFQTRLIASCATHLSIYAMGKNIKKALTCPDLLNSFSFFDSLFFPSRFAPMRHFLPLPILKLQY